MFTQSPSHPVTRFCFLRTGQYANTLGSGERAADIIDAAATGVGVLSSPVDPGLCAQNRRTSGPSTTARSDPPGLLGSSVPEARRGGGHGLILPRGSAAKKVARHDGHPPTATSRVRDGAELVGDGRISRPPTDEVSPARAHRGRSLPALHAPLGERGGEDESIALGGRPRPSTEQSNDVDSRHPRVVGLVIVSTSSKERRNFPWRGGGRSRSTTRSNRRLGEKRTSFRRGGNGRHCVVKEARAKRDQEAMSSAQRDARNQKRENRATSRGNSWDHGGHRLHR
ncbi:hypothetical protein THAOC_20711 [Thalassiosira oceanica]|uniref:Uncharacterized protein n=1 Tax=Thalassiosira oceanica TaxID=159749 RepID=K0SKY1_THAOC|nr:hypothetical protein THAOC_20711 [Thalassiosira oceanica]|eukprot:EJK59107.1 hypothetical protein THAOC_20711 [Thalassiosira oceanica]